MRVFVIIWVFLVVLCLSGMACADDGGLRSSSSSGIRQATIDGEKSTEQSHHRSLRYNSVGVCPDGRERTVIDFDTLADGSPVAEGTYIASQWSFPYGLGISGGRFNEDISPRRIEGAFARIFNSAKPTGNDRDLGSPNKNCPNCPNAEVCPGFSRRNGYGFLVANVTNCEPQNNILIVHGGAKEDEPDDAKHGAVISFHFQEPIEPNLSIEFMDLEGRAEDRENLLTVIDSFGKITHKAIDGLGDNTVQEEPVAYMYHEDSAKIRSMTVEFKKSGAITKIKFCAPPVLTECPSDKVPEDGTLCSFEGECGYDKVCCPGEVDCAFTTVASCSSNQVSIERPQSPCIAKCPEFEPFTLDLQCLTDLNCEYTDGVCCDCPFFRNTRCHCRAGGNMVCDRTGPCPTVLGDECVEGGFPGNPFWEANCQEQDNSTN